MSESEDVALGEAVGRISAQPIVSPSTCPLRQFGDGWLCRASGRPAQRSATAYRRQGLRRPTVPGEWPAHSVIRIMTGAAVPAGCEAVIMQEQAQVDAQGFASPIPYRRGRIFACLAKISSRVPWCWIVAFAWVAPSYRC
ncbi:hypothetical protein [Edwardsiella tarda]|uniref:hypothetical protein n=1 Tax=Edwardsiella tarda TaxID=636 RepID=UPI00351C9B0A